MNIPGQLQAKFAIKGVFLTVAAILMAAVLAWAVVNQVRIDGFKFLFIEHEGYTAKVERLEEENARLIRGAKLATALQEQTNRKAESDYQEIAEDIDDDYVEQLEDELASARRYIANNRVQPEAARSRSIGSGGAAQGDSAENAQAVREAPQLDGAGTLPYIGPFDLAHAMVPVPERDILICTENTLLAETGRLFALRIEAESRQTVQPQQYSQP